MTSARPASDLPVVGQRASATPGGPPRPGGRSRAFIRCTLDDTVPLALQDPMIAEADAATPRNHFDVQTLESSHTPFASMPGRVADILTGR
jgi:hypothetical protein